MDDLDKDFKKLITNIEINLINFNEDEQNIINAWIERLENAAEQNESRHTRNSYAFLLEKITGEPHRRLSFPFNKMPSESKLAKLSELLDKKQRSESWDKDRKSNKKPLKPCLSTMPKQKSLISPRAKPPPDVYVNEFEDFEEMAKVIARSKGQGLIEFVAAISPHTSDNGEKLRNALKIETISFKEHVDRIVAQRIKDLTDILAKEQNAELEKIKNQIDKWEMETVHCKNRIQEMIPDFDFDLNESDENYLKKLFSARNQQETEHFSSDNYFEKWKEEACHRIKWFNEEIRKLECENERIKQEVDEIQTKKLICEERYRLKEQNHKECMRDLMSEINALKQERSKVHNKIHQRYSRQEDPDES